MKLVYIIGLGHSGSTLLDLLLNAHSMMVSVGELKDLHERAKRPPSGKKFCACGAQALEQCVFWSKVAEVLRTDSGVDIRSVVTDCGNGKLSPGNVELLEAIAKVADVTFVVDSSKDIGRLKAFLSLPSFEVLPVFLVREPKGQIASGIRKAKRGLLSLIASYSWRSIVIARLLRHHAGYFLRYEELVQDPKGSLSALQEVLGLSFEPNQLEWATAEHHNCGGNRGVRLSSNSEIRQDDSWRRNLSSAQRLIIDVATTPVNAVLARLERQMLPPQQ